ncbi:acylphosphatase [Fulvivirgaceae bacterium BMA10]|uniref:acylphosphatase n=1 Tax=Splendidivirga corallicola TaxID=3051826 RepID=A0ABT8KN31_9BACT|nr:acylphosphatase [Fulvivirgaceae bacterium BMA10]
MKHYNIQVFGKVQGVFYRASTCEVANNLELRGFVRNQPDGSVYIEAEGPDERIEQLIAWCKQGPSGAIVQRVICKEAEVKGFEEFEVVRF